MLENPSARKDTYHNLIDMLTNIAMNSGYAMGILGSMTKDMDLIFAPFDPVIIGPTQLAAKIALAVDGEIFQTEVKPHGRLRFCILFSRDLILDVSISSGIFAIEIPEWWAAKTLRRNLERGVT